MITALAAIVLAQSGVTVHTICPVMGGNSGAKMPHYVYQGVIYGMCCGGCDKRFTANPDKYIAAKHDGNIGYSEFDPVAREEAAAKTAVAYSDYKNVRYLFLKNENKASFDREPAKFATAPKFEASGSCAVSGETIAAGKASSYRDATVVVNGKPTLTRFYFCCPDCAPDFEKDPAKFAAKLKIEKAAARELK